MKTYGLLLLCAVFGSSALIAPATRAEESTRVKMSDSWVMAKVKIALFADSRVKGREINVQTKKGAVMIRGKVDTDEAKTASEEIAKSVDGAASVKNELQVVPPSRRETVEDKDEAITARVEKHLKKEMPHAKIAVQTNAGVVSLTGEVRNISTSAKASWHAWMVRGVRSVKNDLSVKEKN